jgi:hypothetical protein
MQRHIIEFAPPMESIGGYFNTFRMGIKWSKLLKMGDKVFLVDKPKALVFGEAIIGEVFVGRLDEMAKLHAVHNHNQVGLTPTAEAPERLIANMKKRYGPHIAREDKKVTVIFMQRTK